MGASIPGFSKWRSCVILDDNLEISNQAKQICSLRLSNKIHGYFTKDLKTFTGMKHPQSCISSFIQIFLMLEIAQVFFDMYMSQRTMPNTWTIVIITNALQINEHKRKELIDTGMKILQTSVCSLTIVA